MPKSKRNRVVSLTRTDAQGSEGKEALIRDVRECLDTYASTYLFSVKNMRNAMLKQVRTEWRRSRFFFGKNKVMAIAFGKNEAEAHVPGSHLVSEALVGSVGLFFTNDPRATVTEWFAQYGEADFARSGNKATASVTLKAGPLADFSHTMEPQMRKLGMPTSLQRGVVTLDRDYKVCDKGDVLTPEQCRILKLFNHQQAVFHIQLTAVFEDGKFTQL